MAELPDHYQQISMGSIHLKKHEPTKTRRVHANFYKLLRMHVYLLLVCLYADSVLIQTA